MSGPRAGSAPATVVGHEMTPPSTRTPSETTRPLPFADPRRDRPAEPAQGTPGDEVVFSEEGVVAAGRRVPILTALSSHLIPAGEELRLLRARVLDLSRRRDARCVALTSAGPAEGKSTLALGLAAAMAQDRSRRILLIEADLRKPSLAAMLGLPPAKGLADWLTGRIDYLPVRRVDPGGFYLLVAGEGPLDQPDLLGSTRMGSCLSAARSLFDFALLDAMPLLPAADAVLIQDFVDGFLCVVRSRVTPRDALRAALDRVRPDQLLGTILNDHTVVRSGRRARRALPPSVAAEGDVPSGAQTRGRPAKA